MNYYTRLQVAPAASDKDIQKAYRKLVKQYHPDLLQQASAQLRQQSEEKLKQINIAYTILSNPAKRKQYDATQSWQSGPYTHSQQQARTKPNQANNSRNRSSESKNKGQTNVAQKLVQARREYLHYKQELRNMNAFIWEWFIQLGKTAVIIGLGSSFGAAILLVIISKLFQFGQLSVNGWSSLFLYLNLLIIQVGAIFVVMQQIDMTVTPANRLKALGSVTISALFSFYLATAVTNFTFGEVSAETTIALFDFLGWAYPRMEVMVVEASHLPR